MHICVYMCVHVCVYAYMSICVCGYVYIYVWVCVLMYICVCVIVCLCVLVCFSMHVCVYVCTSVAQGLYWWVRVQAPALQDYDAARLPEGGPAFVGLCLYQRTSRYLSSVPASRRVWHKTFFRWVREQGCSPGTLDGSRNASVPVGIPLKRGA